jgi:hypothetical protein
MRMTARHWTTPALLAVGVLVASAAPASANDATLTVSYGGVLRARATWDDLTDNLCVTALGGDGVNIATVTIRPANGVGNTYKMSDLTDTSGGRCTGNLSIPEDRAYVMTLRWDSESGVLRTAGPKNFYT